MNAREYNAREIAAGRLLTRHLECLGVGHLGADMGAVVDAVKAFQKSQGLTVDGCAGPATRTAIVRVFKLWEPSVESIPHGWTEVLAAYGDPQAKDDPHDPRRMIVSRGWESQYCKSVSSTLIPGYNRAIYMHRFVAPHFLEAMRRAREVCPGYTFKKIGCFNPRHKRFDPTAEMSLHALAIAFDVNPDENVWAPKGMEPFSLAWWRYSDIPPEVVEAWESVGFVWLGRVNGDTMHFQLARGV